MYAPTLSRFDARLIVPIFRVQKTEEEMRASTHKTTIIIIDSES
jgi:hypothetical protein